MGALRSRHGLIVLVCAALVVATFQATLRSAYDYSKKSSFSGFTFRDCACGGQKDHRCPVPHGFPDEEVARRLDLVREGDLEGLGDVSPLDPPLFTKRSDLYDYVDADGKVKNGGVPQWLKVRQDSVQKDLVIARVIGNDYFPLDAETRSRQNLQEILEHESPPRSFRFRRRNTDTGRVSGVAMAVRPLWILNRITNQTELQLSLHALQLHRQLFFQQGVYDRVLRQVADPFSYTANENGGKQTAFREGTSIGALWTFVGDGDVFLTSQSYGSIFKAIQTAENSGAKYIFVPAFRVLDYIELRRDLHFHNITQKVVRVAPQLIVKWDAPDIFHVPAKVYHEVDPWDRVRLILSRGNRDILCPDAAFGFRGDDQRFALDGAPQDTASYARNINDTTIYPQRAPGSAERALTDFCGVVYRLPSRINPKSLEIDGKAASEEQVQDIRVRRQLEEEAREAVKRRAEDIR